MKIQIEELRKRVALTAGLILLIISFGTFGYMFIEGWQFFDGLYMTIITLTTVGYREVHDLSFRGQLFTIVLIIGGVGTVFYALSTGAKIILEGELQEIFGRKRLEKKIKDLKDHYIICGYGRMGRIIARELEEKHIDFVAIEKVDDIAFEKEDVLIYRGDATKDETLKELGIDKARGLISVLPTQCRKHVCRPKRQGIEP